MRYRKRPDVVEASQWWRNGDHPGDGTARFTEGQFAGELLEGKVVRYYRTPGSEREGCDLCDRRMHDHGWIDSGEHGQTVCPGDYIVTTAAGAYQVLKPVAFRAAYTTDHEG